MTKLITCLITFYLTSQLAITNVYAVARADLGGTIQVEIKGQKVDLPVLKTDVKADIEGDSAMVTIVQSFVNPTKNPLHATYLFPLNKDAAVYAMQMEVGDEIVEAKIKKTEQAKKIFKKAKKEGKAASLLTQHRPNMFTQEIANLIPGLPIKVTLKYVQTISKVDGDYKLVVPLIVGPRYQPKGMGKAPMVSDQHAPFQLKKIRSDTPYGKWEVEALPAYPDFSGPKAPFDIDKARVSIKVSLKAGVPISKVFSKTHDLNISGVDDHREIVLSDGRTIDNRDFVLNYRLAGKNTQIGFLAHRKEKDGFFSLLIEPPAIPQSNDIMPREMVFVLDTSGSMDGEPIAASKVFMRHALRGLRPDDFFRIIRFSDNASEFSSGPVSATPSNIGRGLQYTDSLQGNGGTEIVSAIRQAFTRPEISGTLRIVVFLTDGYIGNESEVLKLIAQEINDARIYAFGVGTSINRYLLSEMGRVGRGFARYIDPTELPEETAIKLAKKLKSPVLTDISIDWGNFKASQITPSIIPDLFAGDSIRILGKFEGTGLARIRVNGLVKDRKASLPVSLNLPPEHYYESSSSSIPLIWARTQISDYMHEINTPDSFKKIKISDDELQHKVTDLGMKYSLATRWTSFVAVSRRVVNSSPENSKEAPIPLPMVKGITYKAYPSILAGNMVGHSVPEPATVAGLFIICAAGILAMWCIRKRTGRLNP